MVGSHPPNDLQPFPWQQAIRVCPPDIQHRLSHLPLSVMERVEEFRFRLGQPLQLCGADLDQFLHKQSGLTDKLEDAFMVTDEHLTRVLQIATQSSLYAVEDELRRGFVTMPGGHRVGIAGRAVLYESGGVRSIRNITSLNVRIAKERIGSADKIRPFAAHKSNGRPYSILLVSPPQCGKTTLLRDLARAWSDGSMAPPGGGKKVSVVDERSEIAGCVEGIPQFQLGPRTDILDACPKAEGMLMAIRSLSPDVVVTDEIGRLQDRDAIMEATHAGVTVLATAHANSVLEWRDRPYMMELFQAQAFDRYVVLSRRRGPGTIEAVMDATGKPLGTSVVSTKRVDVE